MSNTFELNGKLEITIPNGEFLLVDVRTKHNNIGNQFMAARFKVSITLSLDLSKVKYIESFSYFDYVDSSINRNLPATEIHSYSRYTSLRFVFKESVTKRVDFFNCQDLSEMCIYQMGFPELETYRVKE